MSREFKLLVLFTALHAPLGVLLYNSTLLAFLHPLVVFSAGIYFAVRKQAKIEHVVLTAAYLTGAEVLWRMAQSPIPWEFGKYGTAVILIIALIRRARYKFPVLPLIYLVCLVPGCLITLTAFDFAEARDKLSSNMSGPFVLAICCWFFSHVKLSLPQIRRMLLAIIIPLVAVACTTLFYTVSNPDIQFGSESNFETSGGFGPNQVSSLLGLGVFAAVTCFLLFRNNFKYKTFFVFAIVFLTAQSVMTFSRGGMYNAIGASLVILIFSFQNLVEGLKRTIPFALLALLFVFAVFPMLNNFTGGKLQERFEDTEPTRRTEIAESDFQMFYENPILGVGVGIAKQSRKEILGYQSASHTEFSRLISEHGSFGIVSLIVMFFMTVMNVRMQPSIFGRALTAGAVTWSSLFMMNSGMRLVAPSLVWAISFVTVKSLRLRKKPRVETLKMPSFE